MIDLLQIIGNIGGVGAVFGLVVFFIYRVDRKASEKRLSCLLQQNSAAMVDYTKAITELTTLLIRMNGHNK